MPCCSSVFCASETGVPGISDREMYGGPRLTTMLMSLPLGSDIPAFGSWRMTLPALITSLGSRVIFRLKSAADALACSSVLPMSSGTDVNSGVGDGDGEGLGDGGADGEALGDGEGLGDGGADGEALGDGDVM